MNKYTRLVLVTLGLVAAATACNRKTEATKEAEETTITGGKMNVEASEAAKLKQEHTDTVNKLTKELDDLDRKGTYLKEKATKTTGTIKKNADAAIIELNSRATIAKTSLSRLPTEAGAAWDSAKKATEDDVKAVEKAVDSLEHTLGKTEKKEKK
jgi:hypothetical protein